MSWGSAVVNLVDNSGASYCGIVITASCPLITRNTMLAATAEMITARTEIRV
ncbi:Uncharacterised protein [Vibrio cholerae]|nr:Uncharacterised protein [Vibrio cholerae]